jgi:hypothetical protein
MFNFNPMYLDATNEQKWEQIKNWRNVELAQSDWTQIADSPADKTTWAAYRQALRDLPAQGGDADKATFPSKPE